MSSALDVHQARADIAEAVKFLSERSAHTSEGLAVIGFSLGAYYGLELSNAIPEHIRAVVVFYGTGHFSTPRRKPSTSATLQGRIGMSRMPTSTAWKRRFDELAAR